ncbi:MAG: hypothetical protein K7J47_24125 [Acidobacteria bacterium]|jgi:hypothetical protein|nr:hypothetical protein [Bryobacteraceae bacterium CoA2 C42]
MRVFMHFFTSLLMPAATFRLGCLDHLLLPKYPPLMRAAQVSADINCVASIIKEGPDPKFRCSSTKPHFSDLAKWVEKEAKVASDCPSPEAKFRLRFVLTSDKTQDSERYLIEKEGIVISIGLRDFGW